MITHNPTWIELDRPRKGVFLFQISVNSENYVGKNISLNWFVYDPLLKTIHLKHFTLLLFFGISISNILSGINVLMTLDFVF